MTKCAQNKKKEEVVFMLENSLLLEVSEECLDEISGGYSWHGSSYNGPYNGGF